jgi:hypothetical protein
LSLFFSFLLLPAAFGFRVLPPPPAAGPPVFAPLQHAVNMQQRDWANERRVASCQKKRLTAEENFQQHNLMRRSA